MINDVNLGDTSLVASVLVTNLVNRSERLIEQLMHLGSLIFQLVYIDQGPGEADRVLETRLSQPVIVFHRGLDLFKVPRDEVVDNIGLVVVYLVSVVVRILLD